MRRTIFFVLLVLCVALQPAWRGRTKKPRKVVLKIGHSLDIGHPVHKALERMNEILQAKSAGRMTLEIYPNEQLGSEREMVEQVQLGVLDMVKTSTAPLESFIPEMGVFSLPYIFRDSEHYWRVLNGEIGKELLEKGEKVGLRGLCYFDAGSRSFYTTKKMIKVPDDLKGMDIRVMESKTSKAMVKSLGGAPTSITWGELYTSLQQGAVVGAENNPPSFETSRHYEVCKFYSLDEHTRIPDIVLISVAKWKKLKPEDQKILKEAAVQASLFQRELWKEKTKESLAKVKSAGVKVFNPDKKLFSAKVEPLLKTYTGTPIGNLIERIKNVK